MDGKRATAFRGAWKGMFILNVIWIVIMEKAYQPEE